MDEVNFVSHHACGAYIVATNSPDLIFRFTVCSQYRNSDTASTSRFNKVAEKFKVITDMNIPFVSLETKTTKLNVLATARFA